MLSLIALVCAGPALSADLPQRGQELLAARMVTLTPTNQSGMILAVTLTNSLDGPVQGRVYVVGSTNHADLSPGLAVVDWTRTQPKQDEETPTAYEAMMMFRYGLGTKFELEGGGKDTVSAIIRSGFSPGNGIRLVIQYLPPKTKEESADWSKVQLLTGEVRPPSDAERVAPPNAAAPHR